MSKRGRRKQTGPTMQQWADGQWRAGADLGPTRVHVAALGAARQAWFRAQLGRANAQPDTRSELRRAQEQADRDAELDELGALMDARDQEQAERDRQMAEEMRRTVVMRRKVVFEGYDEYGRRFRQDLRIEHTADGRVLYRPTGEPRLLQPDKRLERPCELCLVKEARPKRSFCSEPCWLEFSKRAQMIAQAAAQCESVEAVWESKIGAVTEYRRPPLVVCARGDWSDSDSTVL